MVDAHGASGLQPLQVYPSTNNGEPAIVNILLLSSGTISGRRMSMCKIKQSIQNLPLDLVEYLTVELITGNTDKQNKFILQ